VADEEDVNRVEFDKPQRKSERRGATGGAGDAGDSGSAKKRDLKARIPKLPDIPIDPATLERPDTRARACVNLRLAGASFYDIAKELGYADAGSAQHAYYSALAGMAPMSNIETLRAEAALRAEAQFKRSFAMAGADYLVDAETGEKLPNTDRLRWHEQAGKDLALHVAITGAKAPARVEVSASTQELNQIVETLLLAQGQDVTHEADVFEISELPPAIERGEG
jgi:hypothetical protein